LFDNEGTTGIAVQRRCMGFAFEGSRAVQAHDGVREQRLWVPRAPAPRA
jgi:hypothetical protein